VDGGGVDVDMKGQRVVVRVEAGPGPPSTDGPSARAPARKGDGGQTLSRPKAGTAAVGVPLRRDSTRIRYEELAQDPACDEAGVPWRLLHDFHRTAARNLERARVARSVAMMYRRYMPS